jgi:carboxylate-amine ligase
MPETIDALRFQTSEALTIGCELEVMLVDASSGELTPQATSLQQEILAGPYCDRLKLEITQSMYELNTGIHVHAERMAEELAALARYLDERTRAMGVRVCGGGIHPFHCWTERRISPTDRFIGLADRYGYLAKQFTVFGQHIHVGVKGGDDAIRLMHALARYVPQLIALAAASPLYRSVDTSFDCCRLNFISSFPLSGHAPGVATWDEFCRHIDRLTSCGIVESLKDLYWDVRPKPAFGTVEVRVCDTPLDIQLAADMVAYVQTLAAALLQHRGRLDLDGLYLPYAYNRFQACRFGLDGRITLPWHGQRTRIADDVLRTIDALKNEARDLGSEAALDRLHRRADAHRNGASWIRERVALGRNSGALVLEAADRWIERAAVPQA